MPERQMPGPDNRWKRLPETLMNIILLGFLWTVCSLGVITVGAATVALNQSMKDFLAGDSEHPVKEYFRAFRENFKLSTLVWLLHLLVIAVLALDLLYYSVGDSTLDTLAMVVMMTLLTLIAFEMSVVFACIVEYPLRTVRECFSKAVDVAFRCFVESLEMLFITAAVVMTGLFLFRGILIFAAGIIAFADWKILPRMFRKYKFKRPHRDT